MFKRVLVATDFSAHANRTLECIGEIPGMEEILLVHVVNGTGPSDTPWGSGHHQPIPAEHARAPLEEKRRLLEQFTGVPVKAAVLECVEGDIAGAIIDAAQKEDATLIVVGARGKGIIRGFLLGSVSESVLRRSGTHVLIMHFRGEDSADEKTMEKFCRNIFSNVLCPVDFSKPSLDTVAFLQGFRLLFGVVFLHVIRRADTKAEREALILDAKRQLNEMTAGLAISRNRLKRLVRYGDPAQEISRVAEEEDASLILMSRYGKSDYAKNFLIGRVAAAVARKAQRPLFVKYPQISLNVQVKELNPDEFIQAEGVWERYHQQKADPSTDRIFGVFVEGMLAAVARSRRHPVGLEVDGVFVPEEYRNKGYARKVVRALVDACGSEPLYMHSTLDLVDFYSTFGFRPIPEPELPPSIKARFGFAEGDMKGANVSPMRRPPSAA